MFIQPKHLIALGMILFIFLAGAYTTNRIIGRDIFFSLMGGNHRALADDDEDDDEDEEEDDQDEEGSREREEDDEEDREKTSDTKESQTTRPQQTREQDQQQEATQTVTPANSFQPVSSSVLPAAPPALPLPPADKDKDGLVDSQDPHPDIPEIYIVKDDNSNGIVDNYEQEQP